MTTETPTISLRDLKAEYIAAQENLAAITEEHDTRWESVQIAILELEQAFKLSNAELIQAMQEESARAASLEQTLRSAVVAEYEARAKDDPKASKQLGDGLSVQVRTTLTYDESAAVEWARRYAPVLVRETVDRKEFEAFYKGLTVARPAFVKVETKVVAVIKD